MQPNKDLLEFIDLLNANRVEYLVVGGFAVAWHGYPRFTADIDFLVRPDKAKWRVAGQDSSGVRLPQLGPRSGISAAPTKLYSSEQNRIALT